MSDLIIEAKCARRARRLGVLFVLSVYHFPTGIVGRLRAREKTVKTDQARG